MRVTFHFMRSDLGHKADPLRVPNAEKPWDGDFEIPATLEWSIS